MYFTINCPYMIQRNRHLQGAYTNVVFMYGNKIVYNNHAYEMCSC
jgi:hypothetical protein